MSQHGHLPAQQAKFTLRLLYRLKVCEEKLFQTSKQLQEAKRTIELERASLATAQEKMQKLERRLIFVTKA